MKWTLEAKVGAVTIVGLFLFAYIAMELSSLSLFKEKTFPIYVKFDQVNGLTSGNTVRYAGVNVGKVKEIKVLPDGVQVELDIKAGTAITRDAAVAITTDGLVGEKVVQITPGVNKTELVSSGETLHGNGKNSMDAVVDNANALILKVTTLVDSMNKVAGNEQTQAALREMIQNMADITANMKVLTAQLSTSMERIDGDGASSAHIRNMLANMENTTMRIQNMASSLETVVTDPQTKQDLQTTLHNTAAISSRVNGLMNGGGLDVHGNAELLYNGTKHEYGANVNMKFGSSNQYGLIGVSNLGNGSSLDLQYGRKQDRIGARVGLFQGELGAGLDYDVHRDFTFSVEAYNPNDWQYKVKSQLRIMPDVFLVGQVIRPKDSEYGGDYVGLNHVF